MRKRVAPIATCAHLIFLLIFTAIVARSALNSMTQSAIDSLLSICRVSAHSADTAVFANEVDAARDDGALWQSTAREAGIGIAILDRAGGLAFDSQGRATSAAEMLSAPEVRDALANGSGVSIREGAQGKRTIYAARRTDVGRVVRVWRVAPGLGDVFARHAVSVALLILVQTLISFVLIRMALLNDESFICQIVNLLGSFSEGQFDARIEKQGGGSAQEVQAINDLAERIGERLWRQHGRNQALGAVMNQMQTGILAVDKRLHILLITPMAKKLLNIMGTFEGTPVQQASRDVNLEPVLRDAMLQDGVYTNEVVVRTGIGREHRPLRLYVSAMRQDDGAAIGSVALIEDITELRRLEQVRNDFAANVSHELKTPLTSIKGFVETLQAGAIHKPEMAEKFLRIIMLEADRLTRLINDILSITKLESGVVGTSDDCIRLDKLACDVVEMLSLHAAEKQITISAYLNEEAVYVLGNPDRVEQMLINLVENGIKYNAPGGRVTVNVYGTRDNAQLLVSDTGIGIDEEHIPRLFERFYRVDKGRSRSMGGTGLGLAIVKHIAGSMGGWIEVHSKAGEGTEFLVTIPRHYPAQIDPEGEAPGQGRAAAEEEEHERSE